MSEYKIKFIYIGHRNLVLPQKVNLNLLENLIIIFIKRSKEKDTHKGQFNYF